MAARLPCPRGGYVAWVYWPSRTPRRPAGWIQVRLRSIFRGSSPSYAEIVASSAPSAFVSRYGTRLNPSCLHLQPDSRSPKIVQAITANSGSWWASGEPGARVLERVATLYEEQWPTPPREGWVLLGPDEAAALVAEMKADPAKRMSQTELDERAARAAKHEARVTKLREQLKTWTWRRKRAATWEKKIARRLAALERRAP